MIGYHLFCAIEITMRQHHDERRWSTINEVLSTHMRTTMVLTNDKGVAYHLRASGAPEPVHKEFYRLLAISNLLGRLKTVATHL